jgi:hypothetical protein
LAGWRACHAAGAWFLLSRQHPSSQGNQLITRQTCAVSRLRILTPAPATHASAQPPPQGPARPNTAPLTAAR